MLASRLSDITLALIFIGAIFATAEVTTVALTKQLGQPGAASFVIGVYAVGSFLVGLVVGGLAVHFFWGGVICFAPSGG